MTVLPAEVKQSQFVRVRWAVKVKNMTLDDLLKPESWVHVAKNFKRGHIVEVEDGENYMELYVADAGSNWAKLALIKSTAVTGKDAVKSKSEESEYSVLFRGQKKFSIVRNSDKQVIEEGIATKLDAELKLKHFIEGIAA